MMSLETLRRRSAAGERFRYLYFWGHRPRADGLPSASCFSQWFASPFVVEGLRYATAEHWMMAEKARLFGDDSALVRVLVAHDLRTGLAMRPEWGPMNGPDAVSEQALLERAVFKTAPFVCR